MSRNFNIRVLAACAVGAGVLGMTPYIGASQAGSDSITVALNSGISTLDPAVACENESGTIILNVYDRLVQKAPVATESGGFVGDSTNIQPKLAESWTVSPDAREFTFKLRQGVKFASGDAVDAHAVEYTLRRVTKMALCGDYGLTAGLSGNIEAVDALDSTTVRIRLKTSDPLFLEALTLFPGSIVDPKVVEANGGVEAGKPNQYMASHAAGSGPFVISAYDPEAEIVLEARPEYWGGTAKTPKVTVKVVKESATRELLLRSGNLDAAFRVPLKDLERLRADGYQVFTYPSPEVTIVGFNNKLPPFNSAAVRQALLYAVPYDQLLKDVLHGYGSQLRGPIPATMPYHSGELVYPYAFDLEKAKALLSEAGGINGQRLVLDVRAGFTEHEEIAVILQDIFRSIGVDLEINKLNSSAFEERINGFKSQMFIADDQPWINDPGYFLGYSAPCGQSFNKTQYCNKQVDGWLDAARHETDVKRRAELYRQVSQAFIDDAPEIMLFVKDATVVVNPGITGYWYEPSGQHRFERLARK